MEIITEPYQGVPTPLIKIEVKNPLTKKKEIYKFRTFKVGEFKKVKSMPPTTDEEGTCAVTLNPAIYLINAMMVEGPKITDETDTFILNKLKQELQDFL